MLAAGLGATVAVAPTATAQSLLDRPPNVSGSWVGMPGTVYFNFVHRFTASDAPERKVSNFPTFLVGAGLPYRLLVGFNYATNSDLAPRYPNEWEFFARHQLLRQDDGSPLDLAGQIVYNLAAEGVDGEVSAARRQGPIRLIGAARILANPYVAGETRLALAGGATVRLARYLSLAGDVGQVLHDDDAPLRRAAWSAGLHFAIPFTPHTLSLHATNTNVGTLQGASRGGDVVRYGFEFTVPLTLRRWFGRPAAPPPVVAAPRVDTVYVTVRDTVRVAGPPRDVADTTGREGVPSDTAAVRAARGDTTRQRVAREPAPTPAPATREARPPRAAPRREPTARPATVTVLLRNMTFAPGRIQITAGTTVVWRNEDQLVHTVTANDRSFDSGLLEPGKTYRRTFEKAGEYPYICLPHPFMRGVVVVR